MNEFVASPMSVLLLNVLQVFFSLFGCVFALKDFGDPALSAWAAPGPGRLLGDGGRMLVFEVGDQGGGACGPFESRTNGI